MKKNILLILALMLSGELFSQDIHFSQFYDSPLNMSPALAGMDNSYARANINYRSQWSAFGKPFQTFAGSYDMPFLKGKNKNAFLGGGINLFHDKAGNTGLTKFLVGGNLSSILRVGSSSYFSMGLNGTYNQRSINLANVRWDSQFNGTAYDPSVASGENSGGLNKSFFDIGAGLAYSYSSSASDIASNDDFTLLISGGAFHLNRPDQGLTSIDKTNMRFSGLMKMHIGIKGSKIAFEPIVAYMKQGGLSEIDFGMLARYKLKSGSEHTTLSSESAITFGACYRLKDALYPIIGYEFGNYGIGISYDINLSSLTPYSQSKGGFEIVLKIRDVMGTWFGPAGSTRFL